MMIVVDFAGSIAYPAGCGDAWQGSSSIRIFHDRAA
jgi:hypothetical protein